MTKEIGFAKMTEIETGTRNIRISDFLALKQIYGVDFSEFFVGLLSETKEK